LIIGTKKKVLDKGWVEFVDMMPHPDTPTSGDMAVVNAARTSFLGESKGHVADKKLLRYLYTHKHSTPFEMVQFKFRIHAPLLTWWQLVRHRTFSFSLQSGRYVEFEDNEFYFPDDWRFQSISNKQGSDGNVPLETEKEILDEMYTNSDEITDDFFWQTLGDYDENVETSINDLLRGYYRLGYVIYSKLLEHNIAKEQARLFLPAFGVYYTGVFSVDAHNLMHFLRLRMANEAQYEIRVYADTIYEHFFKPMMPWTAEIFEESL
jgi:thymidylate synthase (FAD)